MGAITRLAEQEAGAPGNHFLAEADKRRDQLLDIQQLRLAGILRQHVDAKRRLQRREAVELVQHHLRHGIALDLDDDAHRSDAHTSELQSLMRISYAVFCFKIHTNKSKTKNN